MGEVDERTRRGIAEDPPCLLIAAIVAELLKGHTVSRAVEADPKAK